MSRLPNIALLTTGGTIAGVAQGVAETAIYAAGSLLPQQLLAAVPEIRSLASLQVEALFSIDSKDMTAAHWLCLQRRAQALSADPLVDGLVITHGTDTLEETAQLLERSLQTDKPLVLTCAMRPASALSADGPLNLYDAVRTAAHPDSRGRGVVLCCNRSLFRAHDLRKQHTQDPAAFAAGVTGRIGQTDPLRFFSPPAKRLPYLPISATAVDFPRVEICYVGADTNPDVLALLVDAGARGLVLALPGNGSVPICWEAPMKEVICRGVPVVRASRCAFGCVEQQPVDASIGCRPAGDLSPAAARMLLRLELLAALA